MKTLEWEQRAPYPFTLPEMADHANIVNGLTVFYKEDYYNRDVLLVFGGQEMWTQGVDYGQYHDKLQIAAYDPQLDSWTRRGSLRKPRGIGAAVIWLSNDSFLIVGSDIADYNEKVPSEKCELWVQRNRLICNLQNPHYEKNYDYDGKFTHLFSEF